jgi:hypothetical protein
MTRRTNEIVGFIIIASAMFLAARTLAQTSAATELKQFLPRNVDLLRGDFGGSALKITISGLRRHSRNVKSALTCHRIGEERGRVCDLQINVVASTRWLRGS